MFACCDIPGPKRTEQLAGSTWPARGDAADAVLCSRFHWVVSTSSGYGMDSFASNCAVGAGIVRLCLLKVASGFNAGGGIYSHVLRPD